MSSLALYAEKQVEQAGALLRARTDSVHLDWRAQPAYQQQQRVVHVLPQPLSLGDQTPRSSRMRLQQPSTVATGNETSARQSAAAYSRHVSVQSDTRLRGEFAAHTFGDGAARGWQEATVASQKEGGTGEDSGTHYASAGAGASQWAGGEAGAPGFFEPQARPLWQHQDGSVWPTSSLSTMPLAHAGYDSLPSVAAGWRGKIGSGWMNSAQASLFSPSLSCWGKGVDSALGGYTPELQVADAPVMHTNEGRRASAGPGEHERESTPVEAYMEEEDFWQQRQQALAVLDQHLLKVSPLP